MRVAALLSYCYFTMTLTFESQRFSLPVMNEHIVNLKVNHGEISIRWVFSEWWLVLRIGGRVYQLQQGLGDCLESRPAHALTRAKLGEYRIQNIEEMVCLVTRSRLHYYGLT